MMPSGLCLCVIVIVIVIVIVMVMGMVIVMVLVIVILIVIVLSYPYLPRRFDLTVIESSVVPRSTSNALLCDILSKLVPLTSNI